MQRLTASAPLIASETLALFWELLQCSKRFRSYLIETDRARDFVVLVLYYAIESKDDAAKQSIVRMCIFILQTLSVEERFGQKLNVAFTGQETLPTLLQIPNFHGTYADFLIGVSPPSTHCFDPSGLTVCTAYPQPTHERQPRTGIAVSRFACHCKQHRTLRPGPATSYKLDAHEYICVFVSAIIPPGK